ncbi:unnamed protein product, partial [Arabidopsis halleri]
RHNPITQSPFLQISSCVLILDDLIVKRLPFPVRIRISLAFFWSNLRFYLSNTQK